MTSIQVLRHAALAFVCLFCLGFAAHGQTTTITASHLDMGPYPITTGAIVITPVNNEGTPIAFSDGTGAQHGPTAFECQIVTGAITGAISETGTVSGSCIVPDATETTPANILYSVQVCDQSTGLRTSGQCYTLQQVVGVSGATWALDHYGPPASTTNVAALQSTQGATLPTSCTSPSVFTLLSGEGAFEGFYTCVGGAEVAINAGNTGAVGATGATGATGPAGAIGATGPQGAIGLTGATGPSGATGVAGSAATVTVGTTTTLAAGSAATITNSGTNAAAVLNFGIPQGAAAAFPVSSGLVFSTSPTASTTATSAQIQTAIGSGVYQAAGTIFYVDGTPSTCTIGGTSYTTSADCAYFAAKAYTLANDVSTTVMFGSGNYLKNAVWTEPTASPARFAVNLVGTGYQASEITQNTSTASSPMVQKAEPAVNEDFAGLIIKGITFNANNNANSCADLFGLNQADIENNNCIGVITGSNHYWELGEPGQPTAGGGDDNYVNHLIASTSAPTWSNPPSVTANVVSGAITSYTVNSFTAAYPNGTPMTCKVVGFGNGITPGTTIQPTCAASISGGVLTVTPVVQGVGVTGTVDVQVYPTTGAAYGVIYALSDGTMSQSFTNVGDTCGFEIYGGSNSFYHLHPTSTVCGVQDTAGVYSSGQENLYDGTELDTIAQYGFVLQSYGGNVIRGTHAIIGNSYPGLIDFYVTASAGNIAIESSVTLGDGAEPVDYHPLAASSTSYGSAIISSGNVYLLPPNFRWMGDPGYGGLGFNYDDYGIPFYTYAIPSFDSGANINGPLAMGAGDLFSSNDVAITGGTINSAAIGATTPSTAAFTSLSSTLMLRGTAATIASAATIAPTTPLVAISGTTAIGSITSPSGFTSGCFDGLATGAWTTVTTGNIEDAITAVADTSYRFCYWSTLSKWTVK